MGVSVYMRLEAHEFDLVRWLTSRARQTLQYKVEGAGWQGQRWCTGGASITGGLQRLYAVQFISRLLLRHGEVEGVLEVHPKLFTSSEKTSQPQSSIGRYPPLFKHDIIDARRGNVQRFGKGVHGHVQWAEE